MTTLTKERIAEIEADGMCTMEDDIAELCRLALLGLRVEEAPDCYVIGGAIKGNGRVNSYVDVPKAWVGKRVLIILKQEGE